MKWYNPSTDEMEDRTIFFLWWWKFMERKFYFKVWLLKKIIRYFGLGVMNEVIGTQEVSAHDMFLESTNMGKPRGNPLV